MDKELLKYTEEYPHYFRLYYGNTKTAIVIKRSHSGYNHFSKWDIYYGEKWKMDCETKEEALENGRVFFIDLVTSRMVGTI